MARTSIRKPEKYDTPLTAAIEAAGGPTALARLLGCEPSAITQWRRVPVSRAEAVAKATGLPKHILRPDIWQTAA